jgi:hypothetical protein
MKTITLTRGERLDLSIAAKDQSGTVIDLSVGGYTVAAEIRSPSRVNYDLAPTISNTGRILISHDTVALAGGLYQFDVRVTSSTDQYSQRLDLRINEPITPPSPR